MKKIILGRHAKSSWDNPDWTDHSRPLNERGFRDLPLMANYLKTQATPPQIIIASTANRTKTTALYYADALGVNNFVLEEKIYEAYPQTLWSIIQNIDNQYDTVLLIGHNPAMTYLLADVSGADSYVNVPTCGLFQVRFEVEDWQAAMPQTAVLEHFWYPKMQP